MRKIGACALGIIVASFAGQIGAEERLDFEVEFQYGKILTTQELEMVGALAKLAGFKQVWRVSTSLAGFSGSWIKVREQPTPEPPFSRYRELLVGSEKFLRPENHAGSRALGRKRGHKSLGAFWVVTIEDYKFLPLTKDGVAIDINVGEDVEYDDAIEIVELLEKGQVVSPYKSRDDWDWRWPALITAAKLDGTSATHVISYYDGGISSLFFYVCINGETLMVVAVGSSIA